MPARWYGDTLGHEALAFQRLDCRGCVQEHKKPPLVCQGMGRKCWTVPPPPLRPPLGVESRVSPMWWSRGNSFDLLHSDPPNLGAKQNNRTAAPDVLGRLRLGMRAVVFTPVWKTWEVCLPEPTAGVLKERSEARKEASIPLKCTDNWIPMGCSRRGLL